ELCPGHCEQPHLSAAPADRGPAAGGKIMQPKPIQPKLSRRAVLRGAGAALALPFLESLAVRSARAAGAPVKAVKPPLRMGIFTATGGTVVESWKMQQAGPLDKLPSILRPLEAHKDQ